MSSAATESETVAPPADGAPVVAAPVSMFFKRAEALLDRAKKRSAVVASEVKASATAEHKSPAHGPAADPAIERASEILDCTGETIGKWATTAALQVRRAAALAREEGEDMLAEAQALRKKQP